MFDSNDDDICLDEGFLNDVFEHEENFSTNFSSCGKGYHIQLRENQEQECIIKDVQANLPCLISINEAVTPGRSIDSNIVYKQTPFLESQTNTFHPDTSTHLDLGNKENKRKHASSPVPWRSKKERKFPGPAGLLPDRKSSRITPLKLETLLETDKSPENSFPDELCSQGRCSGSILEEEPWQNFLTDLGTDKNILEVVNVASIKRKAAAKCFAGRKVPFLAAVLHHLDMSSPDPCIILRDSTGEIHGTLHRDVWEQFAGDLIVGSVLVIRNVGLLSTGALARRHYLNITANNLATIYSANPEKSYKTRLQPLKTQDFIQTIENWRTLVRPSFGVGSPSPVGSPTLFNSSHSSPVPSPVQPNSSINHRRTETSQHFSHMTQSIHPRQFGAHNSHHGNKLTSTPEYSPRTALPPKRVGKNLLPSFVPKSTQNTPYANNNKNNFQNIIITSSPSSCNLDIPITNTGSAGFKFNPVITNPNMLNQKVFPLRNSENSLANIPKAVESNSLNYNSTSDLRINNSKLVLSQSSQLTVEEQSLVESVFDGIDADSLFDDDF